MDGMGLTMGMSGLLFVAIWVVMMVAMMFPSAAPMILIFARVQAGKRGNGQVFVPTWVFSGAYLLIWTVAGVLAYLLALGAQRLADESGWLASNGIRVGGAAIVLAGIYQLTPLKRTCLARCRSPLAFVMTAWREGYGGALRMGLEHGLYCLGCCWLLFVILFPIGMMNVAVLALITLVIFAEKTLPFGEGIARLVAVGLIVYGLAVVLFPDLLPALSPHHQKMQM